MSRIKYSIFGMLFFLISCRCIIEWMPSFGIPLMSTTIVGMGYLCTLFCIGKLAVTEIPENIKKLSFLFCVYTTFVIFQLFISPSIRLDNMQEIPINLSSYLQSSFILLVMMLSVVLMQKYLNIVLYAKTTFILILLFLIAYAFRTGFEWYGLVYMMKIDDMMNFVPVGFMSGLQMGKFVGLLFACNLYLADKWSNKLPINLLIVFVVCIFCFVIQFIMVERGPILFQVTILLIYLYAKRIISVRNTIWILPIFVIIYSYSSLLLEKLFDLSPEMLDKIFNNEGGSGRYGSEDALYACALKQIINNPIFGSHCRMTDVIWLGSYPHNIILEILMTFGLVFSIPTMYYLWKAFVNAFRMLRDNTKDSLFAIVFLITTLSLLTSYSLLNNVQFWLSFAYVLSYSQLKNVKMKYE